MTGKESTMKRVKAACILQTPVFLRRPELGLTSVQAKELNHVELAQYKAQPNRAKTRYLIADEHEEADGSVVVHVKKQYNDTADVSEYF